MVAHCNRADHYIFPCDFYLSFFSSPNLSGRRLDVYTWCGLSANLECMFEMCCMWLTGNAGPKKLPKNAPSGHHRTTLSDDIFATKACIDNQKKMLNSNASSTCPDNMVNFGPLAAEICWRVWGTPVILRRSARGLLKIQDAKNRHFGTIAQLCRAISSELRHVSTIGKKLVKQQYLLRMTW